MNTFSSIHIGDKAQTFKASPKFEKIDMVVLNISDESYVSSPSVRVDELAWDASDLGKKNGDFTFEYNGAAGSWMYDDVLVSLEDYGIFTSYNVETAAVKSGDKVTVNRFCETANEENQSPEIQINAELTRTGKRIEVNCPLCKASERQQIADNLLASMSGYGYQPFSVTGAELNPLADLGDAVTINGVYGGIYHQDITFDQMMLSDLGAPFEEELESEYAYEDSQTRSYKRRLAEMSADFTILDGKIAAKVSRIGGNPSSFGWELLEDSWTVKANDTDVLKATKDGLEIYGKVTAVSGAIGGFDIADDALSTNGQTYGGNVSNGVYLGPSGLQLGTKFKVDMNGNLTATSGKFSGTVQAGKIAYGGNDGTLSGSGISSGTVTTTQCNTGVNQSLGYADFSNLVFAGTKQAKSVWATSLLIGDRKRQFVEKTISFVDGNGITRTMVYLGLASE